MINFSRIIFILFSTINANDLYNITRITSSSGLYFEFLGQIQFYNNEQQIITYLNLESQDAKFKFINHIYEESISLITNVRSRHDIDLSSQKEYLKQFRPDMKAIDNARNQLNQLLGHSERVKRGWFDFVGIVAKELFGVMDSEDAEKIDEKLTEFEKCENLLATTIKHQSEVVRSTIINFNNTMATIKHNEDILNDNMNTFRNILNMNAKGSEILQFEITVDEHILQISHFINNLQTEYETLINAVLFAKKGILHPSIMSPEQLYNNLQKLILNVPTGLRIPIPVSPKNSHLLLNIIDLVVYFYKSKLVYIIKIPLLTETYFDTYKLIPMPVKISNDTYAFIKAKNEFLSIRSDKQKYIMISEPELNKCKDFSKKFLCFQNQPLSDPYNAGNCETKLILQQQINLEQECDIRVTKVKNNLWYRLNQRNSWLFMTSKPNIMTINCEDPHFNEDAKLKDTGILNLNEKCTAYVDNTMLEPTRIYSTTVEKDFIPAFNICETVCIDEKFKKINVSYLHYENHLNPNVYKLDELNLANMKLKDIEYYANFILQSKKHTATTNVLTYVVSALVLYYCYSSSTNIVSGPWRETDVATP